MSNIVVDKNNLNSYKLKITALSPVHIGTGEVYEPTNYVIDDGYLYEFDEKLLLQILPENLKQEFIRIVSIQTKNGNEYFEKIHAFVVANKEYAKKVSHFQIRVSKKFEEKYKNDIGRRVQLENIGNQRGNPQKNPRSIFNKFEILKTQREPNNVSTYIPGSSLKGAISTAYQEMLYKEGKMQKIKEFHSDKVFKNLSISDTLIQNSDSQIAFAINKELFENDESEISTMIEVNSKNSEYLATMNLKSFLNDDSNEIKEKITKEKIIKACNEHYQVVYDDKEKTTIKLKPNQFLLSVGKHSGARAVTIDGLRKISVKLCQIQNKRDEGNDVNSRIERLHKKSHFESDEIQTLFSDFNLLDDKEKKDWKTARHFLENPSEIEWLVRQKERLTINAILTQETTTWKFSKDKIEGDNFGWLLCEFIDDVEYNELYQQYTLKQLELIEQTNKSKNKAILAIQKTQEEARVRQQEAKAALEAETKKKVLEELAKQEALSKLSPLEREIEMLCEENPSDPKDTVLYQAIENGKFEESRKEALEYLCKLMKEHGNWKESGKPPKKVKRTQQVLSWLKEIN